MPAPDYHILAGTVMGETRNEIYTKYGEAAYNNAKYGWHHEHVSETVEKMYSLVSGSSVQFLLGTITYGYKEIKVTGYTGPTGSYEYWEEVDGKRVLITGSYGTGSVVMPTSYSVVDRENPIQLEFTWYDANIPFLDKDVADAQKLTYVLR